MGDKNLKAIAVCGTKDISVARPDEFVELSEKILARTDGLREFYEKWNEFFIEGMLDGGVYGNQSEIIAIGDSRGDLYKDFITKYRIRQASCYNCAVKCKELVSIPGVGYYAAKCQSQSVFILVTKIIDIPFAVKCSELCQRYGLDQITTASSIAFAIELYQRSILTEKDTGGMRLEYRNMEVAFSLIGKIARREGIGDILAEGTHQAAHMIGKGAEEFAFGAKKLEQSPYPYNMPYVALSSAVSDRQDYTKSESIIPQDYFHRYQEYSEKYNYADDPRIYPWPLEFQKYFMKGMDWTGSDIERNSQLVHYDMCNVSLADIAGICRYWTGFWAAVPSNYMMVIDLLSAGTGIDMDEAEAFKIIKRASALLRAYNVRLGIRRKDDTVSEKFFRESAGEPYLPLDHDKFNKMVDKFYELRGWDSEGIPSRETLDELDLGYVRQDLEQKSIL